MILGRAGLLRILKENQLLRALRVDKFTLAALEATLQAYVREEAEQVPAGVADAYRHAQPGCSSGLLTCKSCWRGAWVPPARSPCARASSMVGGGALPLEDLPTTLVELHPARLSASRPGGASATRRPPGAGAHPG